jgi:hypothetical protein
VVFVGNFPKASERPEIVDKLREMTEPWKELVEDCFTTRKVTNFGKISFKSSGGMWQFLKGVGSRKYEFGGNDLIASLDKYPAEIALSKRVSKAVKVLKSHYQQNGAPVDDIKKLVTADWDIGTVWYKESTAARFQEAIIKPKGEERLVVVAEARIPWGLDLNSVIDEINKAGVQ